MPRLIYANLTFEGGVSFSWFYGWRTPTARHPLKPGLWGPGYEASPTFPRPLHIRFSCTAAIPFILRCTDCTAFVS